MYDGDWCNQKEGTFKMTWLDCVKEDMRMFGYSGQGELQNENQKHDWLTRFACTVCVCVVIINSKYQISHNAQPTLTVLAGQYKSYVKKKIYILVVRQQLHPTVF